ncbi:bleomycin hydrolase, partial [Chimaeribacter californicus]
YYLKQNIPASTWLNAWGEGEQEKIDGVLKLDNINRIFICGWYPGKTQAEMAALVTKALATVPNPLNKRYTYTPANMLPFTITLSGEIPASLTQSVILASLKSGLESQFGKDSSEFDPYGTGDFQQIKLKDIWAYINNLGHFDDFTLTVSNMATPNGYNDFVYLDVANSILNLTYTEA